SNVADEEVVPPPQRNAPQRTLRGIVVERDAGVVEEDAKLVPLGERVPNATERKLFGGCLKICPSIHFLNASRIGPARLRRSARCASGERRSFWASRLDLVELPDDVDRILGNGRSLDGIEEVAADVCAIGCSTAD